jgi:hypothetical protein
MNFRPGFSLAYHIWREPGYHEVRERDYFFVVSFIVWGLWAGVGAGDLLRRGLGPARLRWAPAVLLLALVPLGLNWKAASRRHGPDATLAADFAYDLLNSAPPYAVLFTYGDNDTFPLWWAQEVAGIRRDVTVICLALANTDWYMRQLRDQPTRPLDPATLPPVWRDFVGPRPTWPLHGMTDTMVAAAVTGVVPDSQPVTLGADQVLAGAVLYPMRSCRQRSSARTAGDRSGSITAGGLPGWHECDPAGLGFELASRRPIRPTPADLLAGAPGPARHRAPGLRHLSLPGCWRAGDGPRAHCPQRSR